MDPQTVTYPLKPWDDFLGVLLCATTQQNYCHHAGICQSFRPSVKCICRIGLSRHGAKRPQKAREILWRVPAAVCRLLGERERAASLMRSISARM